MIDGIRTMLMRGGSSKGLVVAAEDLPSGRAERDDLLLRLLGSPDARQIDGLGGAHPLTSKVAVVDAAGGDTQGGDRASGGEVDLTYRFLQVAVDQRQVSDRQNCGNMLAAVAPFGLERGLLPTPDPDATTIEVRVRLLNTGGTAVVTLPVVDGRPRYDGDTVIAGVPGSGAAIRLDFEGVAGSSCGAMLPTGRPVDMIDGVEVTLVDTGMPVVVFDAAALGVTGTESPAELEADGTLRARLESIRLAAGPLMGLGDVADTTVPKLTMVARPTGGGALSTRTFIPHRCHDAIGVLGALSVATAALLPDTPASRLAGRDVGPSVVLEHPTGTFEAVVELDHDDDGSPTVRRSGIIRTARKLMDGVAFPGPPRL
ncbi:MAG: PrpF domain-containing protein [Actinomycetota bacterium]